MPYWKPEEEKTLIEQLPRAGTLEDLAKTLNRSPDAVAMKLKRLGLSAPPRKTEKSFAKISEKKNFFSATTTTPKLEAVKFGELPSPNEAMGLLWAAVKRLQDPDVDKQEQKKLRLIIQGVKSYIHLDADVVLRLRHIEQDMLAEWRHLAAHYETEIERAKTEEEKTRFRVLLQEAQQHIKEMVEMGVQEPRRVKEGLPR